MSDERPPWVPLEPTGGPPPATPPLDTPPWQPPADQPWQSPSGPPPWRSESAEQPKAGDQRTGPLPLHPMTLSDILDGSFKLLKANWRTVLLITAAFVVPLHLLSAFASRNLYQGRSFFDAINNPSLRSSTTDSSNARLIVGGAVAVVSLLVAPFVAGAISKVVAASYLGGEETVGSALRATGRRAWALFAAWFLVHVLEGIGGVLCILPGLIVMSIFVAVAPAIVIEDLGPIRGMRRSARLLRPRMWSVMGIAIVAGLLASVIGNVLGTVPSGAALAIGLKYGWPLLAAGSILSALVTTPFVAIVATLVYFDGRIRQEGFDLQVMADDLARRTAT
ncbi:MAG: hypothetical protein JO248_14885 [Acidimicrobiia bacterium]|nr:hypothetical protein [Acidimicrobiia bacterium]MBV8985717.1 hypothetical protein [Acidimicrobiia bacterium]